jgi:NAD(P)-dependent dehydrogenase (short-subunit alcohol dehydrogenase family)
VLTADFASLANVRQLAKDIQTRYSRLDVLVNNAGVMVERRKLTRDGYEINFQVNYLAPFLLTNLLLDRLKASAPARIVNVSSAAHMSGRLRWDDYDGRWRVGGWRSYGDSKLALVMFTRELARRLEGTGVTVNSLHPGVIASGFAQEQGNISGLFFKFFRPFLSTTEKGAQTQTYLATSPEVEGMSGEYFVGKHTRRAAPRAYDDDASRRLWDVSARLVGLEATAERASTATA